MEICALTLLASVCVVDGVRKLQRNDFVARLEFRPSCRENSRQTSFIFCSPIPPSLRSPSWNQRDNGSERLSAIATLFLAYKPSTHLVTRSTTKHSDMNGLVDWASQLLSAEQPKVKSQSHVVGRQPMDTQSYSSAEQPDRTNVMKCFDGRIQQKSFYGHSNPHLHMYTLQQDQSLEASKVSMFVDGTNMCFALPCRPRTLFAIVHLFCMIHQIHAMIVFDGPTFDKLSSVDMDSSDHQRERGDLEHVEDHGFDWVPEVKFAGYFGKDAADLIICDMIVDAVGSGRSILLWTQDKKEVLHIEEQLNRSFKLVTSKSHPGHALVEDGWGQEWLAAVQHPVAGDGLVDHMTSNRTRFYSSILRSFENHWSELVTKPSTCAWVNRLLYYHDEASWKWLEGAIRDSGLFAIAFRDYAYLQGTPHGSDFLMAANTYMQPDECFGIAKQHLAHFYEWSCSQYGALVLRQLLRRLRKYGEPTDRRMLCSSFDGHWGEMVLNPNASIVLRVLVSSSSFIPSRFVLDAFSQSLGPNYLETIASSLSGSKVLEVIVSDRNLTTEELLPILEKLHTWALHWIDTNEEVSHSNQADLIKAIIMRLNSLNAPFELRLLDWSLKERNTEDVRSFQCLQRINRKLGREPYPERPKRTVRSDRFALFRGSQGSGESRGRDRVNATVEGMQVNDETLETLEEPAHAVKHSLDAIVTLDELNKMARLDLIALCREKRLEVSGNRQDVIDRLNAHFENMQIHQKKAYEVKNKYVHVPEDLTKATRPALIALCRDRGLKANGKKQELIDVLNEHLEERQMQFHKDESQTPEEHVGDDSIALENLKKMKRLELIALCRDKGLKSSGKKQELVDLLNAYFEGMQTQSQKETPEAAEEHVGDDRIALENLEKMKRPELIALCKGKGMKYSGKKQELIDRLSARLDDTEDQSETSELVEDNAHDFEDSGDNGNVVDSLKRMKHLDLIALCRDRGLKVSGKKLELIGRLAA